MEKATTPRPRETVLERRMVVDRELAAAASALSLAALRLARAVATEHDKGKGAREERSEDAIR